MQITHLLPISILLVCGFQAANSLHCYHCMEFPCNEPLTVSCAEDSACLLSFIKSGNTEYKVNSCTPKQLCNRPPVLAPPGSMVTRQSCCYTDYCNSAVTTKMSLLTAALLALGSLYVSRF
ncbi:uncharacterized protein RB166_019403 [Leptodactylus fuscus]